MKRLTNPPPASEIPISKIEVEGKGHKISKAELAAIRDNLKENGQIIPIIVSKPHHQQDQDNPTYILRAGRKRLEAALNLDWTNIRAVIIPEEPETDPALVRDLVKIIEDQQRYTLSDYDLAYAAILMESQYKLRGLDFAFLLGLSKPYTYNLMRWYRNAPDKVREAWQNQHPLVNQVELERYSHLAKKDALVAWDQRLRLKASSLEPYNPSRKKNGESTKPPKPRRASEQQITKLETAILGSSLIPAVKELCTNIIKFVLGATKEVPGVTNYQRLKRSIVSAKNENRAA